MVHGMLSQTVYVQLVIMSSTNSSDRLTFLSYVTFNYNIPLHDHSWMQHHWKHTETMVAISIISLTECIEALSEEQFGKQMSYLLCLELTFAHKALVLIPTFIGDFTDFCPGHFHRQINLTTVYSAAQMDGVYETPMFVSASQNTTIEKPLWHWRCISPAATASNQ